MHEIRGLMAGGAVVFAAGILAAPPALALPDTSPSVSPSVVAPTASPAMTFTYSVTGVAARNYTGVGVEGFTVPGGVGGENVTPVLSGTTVTCTFGSGVVVTWESPGFSAGVGGEAADCSNYDFTADDGYNYVELYLGDDIALAGGTVTLTVSAGGFTAPGAEGSYGFQAYVWDGSQYVQQGFGTVSVGGAATPDDLTIVRQSLPMPESGTCADVRDQGWDWGTGLSGGWQQAWEPWVGSGGGWACSRAMAKRGGAPWAIDNSVL